MKIVYKEQPSDITTFGQLKLLDTFVYQNVLSDKTVEKYYWLKVGDKSYGYDLNCVYLGPISHMETGQLGMFYADTPVKKVNSTLEIE